jgi:hypothetical protein
LDAARVIQTLWIPGPLDGMNEIIAKAKGHGGRGYGYSSHKKAETARIAKLAKDANLQPMERVRIDFEWREERRQRDPGNIRVGEKFVTDGLVAAGVIPGDGWRYIAGFSDTWRVDKSRPGVLVTITSA